MRNALLVATALIASSVTAAAPMESRPATDFESNYFFLMVLRDQPDEDSRQMLAQGGVDEARARELLAYLDEHMDDHGAETTRNWLALCENVDERFSSPAAMARELQRQSDA